MDTNNILNAVLCTSVREKIFLKIYNTLCRKLVQIVHLHLKSFKNEERLLKIPWFQFIQKNCFSLCSDSFVLLFIKVFEKALDEPKYSSMYAQLCLRLSEEAPNFDGPGKTGNSVSKSKEYFNILSAYFSTYSLPNWGWVL